MFLVLAAQFESWIHPAMIMLTVPLAALGGLFGLLMAGSTINTYSQIGLIILVGIAAKNGILIVEFANQLRDEGLSVSEAVIEAASLAPAADHHDLDRGGLRLAAAGVRFRRRRGKPPDHRRGDLLRRDLRHPADAVRRCRCSTICWRASRGRRTGPPTRSKSLEDAEANATPAE